MHIKCPKCKNTNFCISQDTIDGVEYNVISCVIDDYIIGAANIGDHLVSHSAIFL